ncbi:MAG: hypothetical protein WA240_02615 [Nitrospirota bacterium]
MHSFLDKIGHYRKRFLNDPLYSLNALMALLKGSLYILYYRFSKKNINIGFPFKAFSKVTIIGPGSVKIGKNCSVYKNVFRGLTIVTSSSDSVVVIGERCALGGLTIRCNKRVEIGDRVMTATSLIQDSFFVNQDKAMSLSVNELAPEPAEISIGNNVWLTLGSTILGRCNVGNDCVIAAGSWCFDSKIDDYSLAIGNPIKKTLPIERLQRLKGIS